MSADGENPTPGESMFDRNLRALLTRSYQPAAADPAFRARARAACLAAVPVAADLPRSARTPNHRREASNGREPLRVWWRAAVLAAVLLVAVSALFWLGSDAHGDGRRDAILARGEAAARTGPLERWQAFGPQEGDDPEDRDVAHTQLAFGTLQVFTPAALGLDVALPGLPGTAGAFIEAASSVRLERDAGLEAALDQGGLSLTGVASGPAWQLETAHGTLELQHGSLSARLLGTGAGGGGDAVWLLLDGGASLLGADSAQPVPTGRALQLRHGALTPFGAGDGAPTASRSAAGFDAPPNLRLPEPLTLDAEPDLQPHEAASAPDLPAPRLVQGRVLRGGAPVTAFRIVLVPQDVPPRAEAVSVDVAASDGRFRWADVPLGSYALFVLAPEAPAWSRLGLSVTATDPIETFDIELAAAGASVAGFVTDLGTGEPLAGAMVLSETDAPARLLPVDNSPMPELVTLRTFTDAQGFFQLDNLSPGKQLLRATAPGHAPAWSGDVRVGPGEHVDGLLFGLATEARARGRVLDADGLPRAGAMLIASPQPEAVRPCVSYAAATTDSDGSYLLANQPAGSGIVILLGDAAAMAAGAPPQIQAASFTPGADAVIDFLLAPSLRGGTSAASRPADGSESAGCRLQGRVFASDGEPARQCMVSIVRQDAPDTDAAEQWRGAMTTDDGRYDFAGLSPGAWELFIGDGDGTSIGLVGVVEVPAAAAHEMDVRLSGGVLAGQATSADGGQPVPRAVVILMRRDVSGAAWAFHGRQLADPSGRFRIEHLPAGRYEFTVHDIDGVLAAAGSGDVLLGTDVVLEGVDVALLPGGSLVVRVRDARGSPVAGALVEFSDVAGRSWQFAATPRTGADGILRSRGMPPGLWHVAVSAPSQAGLASREFPVELRAGQAQDLEAVLPDTP